MKNVCPAAFAVLTVCAGLLSAGCNTTPADGGPEMDMLTAPLYATDLPGKASSNLLPLTKGNQWQMRSLSAGKVSQDILTVVGPATPPGGVPSVEIDLTREGQPWRKEFYTDNNQKGIYLTAMKDETSPLMVFNAPAPLVVYPFKEGQSWTWQGTVNIGGKDSYPVTTVSRLSGYDSATTPAGRFKICRIDTIITLTAGTRDIRFPSVRWFAPGVGFVRRSFADKGLPAVSELNRFNVH